MHASPPSDASKRTEADALARRQRHATRVAQFGYFALFIALFVAILGVDPGSSPIPRAILLVLALVPMLFPLRGIVAGAPRTLSWSTLIALIYWVAGVLLIAGDATRLLGWAVLGTGMLWFWGAFFAVRAAAKRHALSQVKEQTPPR